MNVVEYFLLFIIYAILGWIIEISQLFVRTRKFVNRGFLIGPYCPIYGVGGVLITFFLTKFSSSPVALFVLAVSICAVLEYLTSYIMEKLFDARWWDYSKSKYNINGRICLETMIPFGLLGLVAIYIINPVIYKLFNILNAKNCIVLFVVLISLFTLDLIVSFKIINNFKKSAVKFMKCDNTEEITKKVKERLEEVSKLINTRLAKAFPYVSKQLNVVKDNLMNLLPEQRKEKGIIGKIKKLFKKN